MKILKQLKAGLRVISLIVNASPLIILGKLNKLKILVKIFKNIEIPEKVYNETIIKGKGHIDSSIIKEFIQNGSVSVVKLNNKSLSKKIQLIFSIDTGEAETIALALQSKQKNVIIDEISAREAAKSLNLEPIGTLGVLLIAFKKRIINEDAVNKIIKEMMDSKYRVGANVIMEFWNKLSELKVLSTLLIRKSRERRLNSAEKKL